MRYFVPTSYVHRTCAPRTESSDDMLNTTSLRVTVQHMLHRTRFHCISIKFSVVLWRCNTIMQHIFSLNQLNLWLPRRGATYLQNRTYFHINSIRSSGPSSPQARPETSKNVSSCSGGPGLVSILKSQLYSLWTQWIEWRADLLRISHTPHQIDILNNQLATNEYIFFFLSIWNDQLCRMTRVLTRVILSYFFRSFWVRIESTLCD